MIIRIHELACNSKYELAVGLLSRAAGGVVSLSGSTGTFSFVDPELNDYDDLIVGILGDWFVALGDRSSTLLVGDKFASVPLSVGGVVSRICLDECYDPGGLDRVKYFGIDEDSFLVETEMGFWRFSRSKGIVWGVVHEDVTRSIKEVDQEKIVVYNEYDTSLFSVTDGSHIMDKPFD